MFQFKYKQFFNTFIVIGAGGTGSRLIPLLSQFLSSIDFNKQPIGVIGNPRIVLIDDDIVEEKNLLRQNFVKSDIGKPKAEVLAKRYESAYGCTIIPITERVTGRNNVFEQYNDVVRAAISESPISDSDRSGGSGALLKYITWRDSVVILAVDNNTARKDILNNIERSFRRDSILSRSCPLIIDAGNEDDFGQVRFFHLVNATLFEPITESQIEEVKKLTADKCIKTVDLEYIPMDADYYGNLPEVQTYQASCEEMPQTLAINAYMAVEIMALIQNMYLQKPIMKCQTNISLNTTSVGTFMSVHWLVNLLVRNKHKVKDQYHYYQDVVDNYVYTQQYAQNEQNRD